MQIFYIQTDLRSNRVKTYILGDIHGEYERCADILLRAGIIDEEDKWKRGLEVTLIQVGDVIDRGKKPIESFKLIRDIQEQAAEEGGKVLRLLGNHELSMIGGPLIPGRSRSADYILADVIKQDIIDGKITAAYLLDEWVVVHAGIIPEISESRNVSELVEEFNKKLINAVMSDDFSDEIFGVGRSRGGYGKPGIFWADYDIDLLPYEDGLIKQIVGHSPPHVLDPEIKKSPNGRIINIDIGMCDMYGGHKGILIYEDKKFDSIIF